MEYKNYLAHFNKNHDPKTGKFAKSAGSTAARAAITGAVVGAGFAAERAISNKMRYPDAGKEAMVKSSAIAFGRASVAAALAVIGNDLVRNYKTRKGGEK